MANYNTGTDNRYSSRGGSLRDAEKTWEETYQEHQQKLAKETISLYAKVSKEAKNDLEKLFKISKDAVTDISRYRTQQLEKYKSKYGDTITAIKKAEVDAITYANKLRRDGVAREFKEYKAQLAEQVKQKKKSNTQANKELRAAQKQTARQMRDAGASYAEIMKETGKLSVKGVAGTIFSKDTLNSITNHLVNGLKSAFDSTIQTYGQYQSKVNTRLQGSGITWNGSSGIEATMKNAVGVTPYVKLQSVMDNVVKATEAGIAYNIEQRAFLQTISENIADTFNAFDSNLLRIIRLQQSDSTAARLGMEAGLTNFYNSLFSDSSYLNSAYDTVSQNLTEALSTMSTQEGVAFEYTIQKWLGSLYSVGASDSAISKISQALGYLASGNVSALASDSSMQSLLAMAATRANLNYGSLMGNLSATTTNTLLESMVEYLAEIAEGTNNVVKSEYAGIFGMTISDLKAVANVSSSISNIADSFMSYGDAYKELTSQMGQISSRMSVAGLLNNTFSNFNYNTATGIAGNPALYALWQVTSMIEDLTGGIALPTVSVLGNSVDLNTTVTNLMRTGIVGAGTLSGIGAIISGISSLGNPSSMLTRLGITGTASTQSRGTGLLRKARGSSISSSTYAGNMDSSAYYTGALTAADETVNTTISAKKAEATEIAIGDIHQYLLSVFDPKITAIEQMIASFGGYGYETEAWGNYKTADSSMYQASRVTLTENVSDAVESKAKVLDDLKQTTVKIYDLLDSVVSGNVIRVSIEGESIGLVSR